MIKLRGKHTDGRPVALLCVTAENITTLIQGKPILSDLGTLGIDVHVAIQ